MAKYIHDVLYGPIHCDAFIMKIIDTPEFQRLRDLKQLGFTYLIFPSACHSRFEHSLGAYYMAGKIIQILLKNSDSTEYTSFLPRHGELIQLAALVHDIGHIAFCHTWDHLLEYLVKMFTIIDPNPNNLQNFVQNLSHESRSVQMVAYLNEKYTLGLTPSEVEFVQRCIVGVPLANYPPWYFQIVSNHTFEIDCDKLDYIQRDSFYTGVKIAFQLDYVLQNSKIHQGQWCFHEKTQFSIYQLFMARTQMHYQVYQHPYNFRILAGLRQFLSNNPEIMSKLQQGLANPKEWLQWTDDGFDFGLSQYLRKRQFPKCAYVTRTLPKLQELKESYYFVSHIGFVSGSAQVNPVLRIQFYGSSHHVLLSCLLPVRDKDTLYYVF